MSGRGGVKSSRGRGKRGKRGGSRGGKRIATADEVMARNNLYEERDRQRAEDEGSGDENDSDDGSGSKSEGSENDDESGPEEGSDDESHHRPIGAQQYLSVENPNHNRKAIEKTGITQLSRREREQIEKQKRDRLMERLQAEGKTHQARADLERLAEVRKRREEAAKLRQDKELESKTSQ